MTANPALPRSTATPLQASGALWLTIVVAAPLLPAGPLALLAGIALLVTTATRLSRALVRDEPLGRWPVAWLLICAEIAAIGELLSLLESLNSVTLWLWLEVLVDMGTYALTRRVPPVRPTGPALRRWWRAIVAAGWPAQVFLLAFALLTVGNLIVALFSGVTVYDTYAVYYPLSVDFMQQGSLTIPPHHPDWPFYHMLTIWHTVYIYVMVLGDTIVGLNALGWIATCAGFVATALICRAAGLSRGRTLVCTAIVFSAPMVVCQAANTNYDQQAGFAMAVVIWAAIRALRQPNARDVTILALAQVLMVATKLTGVFVAPIVLTLDVAIGVRCLYLRQWPALRSLLGMGALATGILLAPHYVRTYSYYGKLVPQTPELSGSPQSRAELLEQVPLSLIARTGQLLIPYQLGWWADRSDKAADGMGPVGEVIESGANALLKTLGVPEPGRVSERVVAHLRYPYNSDRAYFGLLPPILLLMLIGYFNTGLAYRRYPLRRVTHRILWLGVLGWVVFQVGYAAGFKWTPHNGRYMLIAWFLAAPVLAALAGVMSRRLRNGVLILLMALALIEHTDWFHHRAHRPLDVILRAPAEDHFQLIRREYANFAELRALLAARNVGEVHHDTGRAMRGAYVDRARQRRWIYHDQLEFDGTQTLFTNLWREELEPEKVAALRARYDVRYVEGAINTRTDRRKAFLVPYFRRVDADTDVVRVVGDLGAELRITALDAPTPTGGIQERVARDRVWLGARYTGWFRVHVEADRDMTVGMYLHVRHVGAELARVGGCPLEIHHNGERVAYTTIPDRSYWLVRLQLQAGQNTLALFVPADRPPSERCLCIADAELVSAAQMDQWLRAYRYATPQTPSSAGVWVTRFVHEAPESFFALAPESPAGVTLVGFISGAGMGGLESFEGTANLWLGPRDAAGLVLVLNADRATRVRLSFKVLQFGRAVADPTHCPLELVVDDRIVERFEVKETPASFEAIVPLTAGENAVMLRVPEDAGPGRYGDDPRPAMVYVTGFQLQPVHESSDP